LLLMSPAVFLLGDAAVATMRIEHGEVIAYM
jgi:hypothetical protein